MSLKLERLTIAMAEHEGWLSRTEKPDTFGSRSYRNHNPGNLRKSPFAIGTEQGFCVFRSDEDGWAAFRWDIRQKALGNTSTGLNGNSTLKDLIYTWAPAADGNNPEAYLTDVENNSGLDRNEKLSSLIA